MFVNTPHPPSVTGLTAENAALTAQVVAALTAQVAALTAQALSRDREMIYRRRANLATDDDVIARKIERENEIVADVVAWEIRRDAWIARRDAGNRRAHDMRNEAARQAAETGKEDRAECQERFEMAMRPIWKERMDAVVLQRSVIPPVKRTDF